VTFILKCGPATLVENFGGDSDMKRLDLDRPSRLNGGDSQV